MKFAFPPLTPVVRVTLIVLFASFVVQTILSPFGISLFDHLALTPVLDWPLAWQWATYPLVEYPSPGAVVSRAFELLLIYSFGSYAEQSLGRNRTIALTLAAVAAGAVLPIVFGLLFSGYPFAMLPLAGGTAITFAYMGAFAVSTRGAPLTFFLMPTMSAWAVIGIFVAIEALQAVWMGTPVLLFAVLGGLAGGVLFTRFTERRPPSKKAPPKRRAGASHLQVIPGGQADDERPKWLN